MFHIEVIFRYCCKPEEANVANGVYDLLAAWLRNGQVLDSDWPVTYGKSDCRVVVSCPERTSLSLRHANEYVLKSIDGLRSCGLLKPRSHVLGRGVESPKADRCKRPAWYMLMTNYMSHESPLVCGEHGLPVPLYRIPHTYESDPSYWDVLCWQREWKCCDNLQMACGIGERSATRQIANPNSPLAVAGRDLCNRIEKLSDVPTYYYLYRGTGRSESAERKRPCPVCGKQWALAESLHGLIDFKCDRCRLVSNIAWAVRS